MKSAKVRSVLFATLGTLTVAFGQISGVASAATSSTSTSSGNNANSLRISPLRSDITLDPGASGTVQVDITNTSTTSVTLQAIENDFVASGQENGTPAIILNPSQYAPTHSLKRFMIPVPNFTLGPNATQTVTVKIVVPKTAQAGGYYGALRFGAASTTGKEVILSGSVASLILLTVPGPTVEQVNLTNFDIQQNGGTATSFRTPNDLNLFLRFENLGNIQEAPFGQIYVQKGKKIMYKYNFNGSQPQQEILPDSYRRWNIPLKGMGKFGHYTIGATLSYGSKGTSIDITKSIWIIPSGYIIAGVVTVVLLVLIIGGSWMFLKSYKKRILKSSRRRY